MGDILVRLGEYDLSKVSDTERTFNLAGIKIHEGYLSVAIAKLYGTAALSRFIQPICLPGPGLILDNKIAYVAGNFVNHLNKCYLSCNGQ